MIYTAFKDILLWYGKMYMYFRGDANNKWIIVFNAKYTARAVVCSFLSVFNLSRERWICWNLLTGYLVQCIVQTG